MAFIPSFTSLRSTTLADLILEDTSTGSDAAILTRYVYITLANGDTLPDGDAFTEWPLSDGSTITFSDLFNIDYALNIKVEWRDASSALYTVTELKDCPQYSEEYAYYLAQLMAGNPKVVDRSNWFPNLVKYYCFIQNSITAVVTGEDIAAAQYNLNQARNMSSQPNVFFT